MALTAVVCCDERCACNVLYLKFSVFHCYYSRKLTESLEHELTLLSFIATYNKLRACLPIPKITELSFISLISNRSTSMDSIFTTTKNFQDFFRQINEPYGALLCDERACCIANKIQLLRPDEFGGILIGMGPFHCNWSKILTAAMGKCLDQSGISKALYALQVFLKGTAETSFMKGGDYIYGNDEMSVIAEAMTRLKFEAFEQSKSYCLIEGFINMKELSIP